VAERARAYREILGDAVSRSVSDALNTALEVVRPLTDDTSQRFAALDLS